MLKGTDLVEQDVRFRYLAAKCLVECEEWEECLKMVGGWEDDSLDSIDMQVRHGRARFNYEDCAPAAHLHERLLLQM